MVTQLQNNTAASSGRRQAKQQWSTSVGRTLPVKCGKNCSGVPHLPPGRQNNECHQQAAVSHAGGSAPASGARGTVVVRAWSQQVVSPAGQGVVVWPTRMGRVLVSNGGHSGRVKL